MVTAAQKLGAFPLDIHTLTLQSVRVLGKGMLKWVSFAAFYSKDVIQNVRFSIASHFHWSKLNVINITIWQGRREQVRAPGYIMAPGLSEQSISSWNKIFAAPPTAPPPLSTVLQFGWLTFNVMIEFEFKP